MRKRLTRVSIRVVSLLLAMTCMVTPAFALVREVEVYGVKSINDMGNSDLRVDMDTLKDDYSDFVQTDTLREYFHQDKPVPDKVDLDEALSWLIDNNIISRDQTITVSNCGRNQIPQVSIQKFDTDQLKSMQVMRADLLMYVYKAAFGPINARAIAVETDNVRVDDGEYITLRDLMLKNGYTLQPSNVLPGSGTSSVPGNSGSSGTGNGGGGAGASGSSQQTNYINDMSNWRYQPQGDLWESIFGDTNIFISQNNFQQGITGGNGGGAGGGGAGIGSGGSGGTTGNTVGQQTQVNTGDNGSIHGSDDTLTSTNSNNINAEGRPQGGTAGSTGTTGGGSASYSTGSGGSGGNGGNANTGDNIIDYDTDYKQIYFIPGVDLLIYNTSDVPEVYIQEALKKGILDFDSEFRSEDFTEYFVDGRDIATGGGNATNIKRRSWDGASSTYVVNRTRNKLKTVDNVESVPTQQVLGKFWSVNFQSNTLTIQRTSAFANSSDYFTNNTVSKMDAYEYVYHFIYNSEKALSELESDIVNYKYGMELDGITDDEGTNIIKYLIAKGIINYEVTNEFMMLDSPIAWSDLITLLYRTANRDARLDFSKIQLTDSETQWKARGYAPQTAYMVPGDNSGKVEVMTVAEFATQDFGTGSANVVSENVPEYGLESVAGVAAEDGRTFVRFGAPAEESLIVQNQQLGELFVYELTAKLEGALVNHVSTNGVTFNYPGDFPDALGVSAPSTNMGKYVMSMVYDIACSSEKQLKATWTSDFSMDNPKLRLMAYVCCNIWALADIRVDDASESEVRTILSSATYSESVMSQELKDLINANGHSKNPGEFVTAMTMVNNAFERNSSNVGRVEFRTFQFGWRRTNANSASASIGGGSSPDWAGYCGGSIQKLVNEFVAVEFTVTVDNEPHRMILVTSPLAENVDRGYGGTDANSALSAGNGIVVNQVWDNSNSNLTTEEQELQALLEYSNNVTTFAALESCASTTPLQTFVEPDTKDGFITWSTLQRYRQNPLSDGSVLPIKQINDYVLYNEKTSTYAYFSDKEDQQMALVGTDIVKASSDYGVIFKEGSEVYYSIDVVRLLMDAKQEAEILGGIRTMPLSSVIVQRNLTEVSIDNCDGAPATSLTGISVMLSDQDSVTKEHIRSDSVYFTDTSVYNDVRWGNFLAISQSNRAINATARQFSYTGKDGTKLSAYAVVIFEPLAASDIESTTVDATSSLQDLLDAPMRKPETAEGLSKWEKNKAKCNLLANWVYGTTGKTYIETGYIEPHAYVFSSDPDIAGCMSEAEWSPLNNAPDAQLGLGTQRELVEFVRLYQVINGSVKPFGSSNAGWNATSARNHPQHRASYMLSADYQVCIMGNRIYMNLGCFKNMTKTGTTKLRASNIALGSSAFTVGSTFKSIAATGILARVDGKPAPKIMVTETKTDGTVYCQVGPIYGLPMIYKNVTPVVIHDFAGKKTDTLKTLSDFGDWTSSSNSQVQWVFEYLFQPTGCSDSYANIELIGITKNPTLSADSTRSFLFDGLHVKRMSGEGRTEVANGDTKDAYQSCMTATSPISTLDTSLSNALGWSVTSGNVETYFTIKFNAFEYTIENGVLKYKPNQATDYISPSLFTSLNDLIINEMMNADNGAIPIEQIPFGSILQIGTGWYTSHGNSEDDIAFVGYAPLQIVNTTMTCATLQDVSKSYATQFIRAGNQQINISHFFKTIEVLKSSDAYSKDLKVVADSKLSQDKSVNKQYILGSEGEGGDRRSGDIVKGDSSAVNTYFYAPVNIAFQKGILKAYCTSPDGEEPATYVLVSNAETSVTGPLDDLPFFSDSALSGTLSDRTSKGTSGAYQVFYGANYLLNNIRADFQKAFAGDLFTLARMLLFIVLVWLVVASWMCYGIYFGRLMPILDAIKHPSGDKAGKGVDLMKIVSLGSISLETDFKLGRFIQYNAVLAVLLCAVYLSGKIA